MRKLDYLRKLLARSKYSSELEGKELPDGFKMHQNDLKDTLYIINVERFNDVAEITVCHAFNDDEHNYFVDFKYEYYCLKPRKKFIFNHKEFYFYL